MSDANLNQISTYLQTLTDPVQFTMRYAPAIERYLHALLRDPHDAEEVLQDFLVRGLERGFVGTGPLRGRFRDYLKAAVRNAAVDRLRLRRPPEQGDFDLGELPAHDADSSWLEEWRQCVLGRVWDALLAHQKRSPGNLFHTVLRLTVDHPDEDSAPLAERASTEAGRPVAPAAFRKQLSRARRQFAELLVAEVRRTLPNPSEERVAEELADLGLLSYVRDLPAESE